jgi:protein tyrosine phosphatase (PTP) superfamily phosphohydrolase (DUF442 family)
MTDSMRSDPTDIFQWRRVDDRLTTSGQPTEKQLPYIKDLGVTHIVNLGLHEHEKALPDEAASVLTLGMHYVHIPVDFDNPTPSDYEKFRDTMHGLSDRVIHVHCIANLRVSAFLYRYRRDHFAMPEAIIRKELDSIWRPGGVWARFINDDQSSERPHRYAGRDY